MQKIKYYSKQKIGKTLYISTKKFTNLLKKICDKLTKFYFKN